MSGKGAVGLLTVLFLLAATTWAGDEAAVSREEITNMLKEAVRINPQRLGFFNKGMELVRVGLANPLNESLTCKVTWEAPSTQWQIKPASKVVPLSPKDSVLLTFEVYNVERELRDYPAPEVKIEWQGKETLAEPVVVTESLKLLKVYRTIYFRESPVIDGKLNEWKNIRPIELGKEKDFSSSQDSTNWGGPKDLSAEVYVARDADNFYVAARVQDDAFSQANSDALIYEGDSMQIAIDVLNDQDPFFRDNNLANYEYAFALTPKGPLAWRHIAPQGESRGRDVNVSLAVVRDEENKATLYEAAIPLFDMQSFNRTQRVVGFSVIISDNDGKGRKGWLQWTPGVGDAREAVYYGEVIFGE